MKLRNCPFCGSSDIERCETVVIWFSCNNCFAETNSRESEQEAADAWNQRQGEWQPIETAPKDGRVLLLGYFNSHGKWRSLRGEWVSREDIDENWEDPETGTPGWYENSVENDDIPNLWYTTPAYWMPLPEPPVRASLGELI